MPRIIQRTFEPSFVTQLQTGGYSPLMSRIFAARGVSQSSDLSTKLADLLPPKTLRAIEAAAEHLADALARQERLLIIADYDCDGATACAVGVRALRMLGAAAASVDFIVPNRFEYGYGLTPEIVQLAAQRKPDWLITVDNGIASVDGVATAQALGIRVLVTDHHLPGDVLPNADCIVNPNQPDDTFASKNLAGVGVIFYTMLMLRQRLRERGWFNDTRPEPNLASLLDLVALGTVADVVRLDNNNRILVHQGLQRIRAGQCCVGITELLKVGGRLPHRATTYDLGFVAGPRVNAAGRLEDMRIGINCLLTDDAGEAQSLAAQLNSINQERRAVEAQMQEQALYHLEDNIPDDQYSICFGKPEWHQGVIGIVASRLKDKFHRPTICFAPDTTDGLLKGSGRSIQGFHLRDALDLVSKRHPTLIKKFGGHAMAAGLTIALADFNAFKAAFETVAKTWLSPDDLSLQIAVDGSLSRDEMVYDTAKSLAEPVWGQGFAEPQFLNSFRVVDQRVLAEKHLRLTLEADGRRFSAVRFGSPDDVPHRIDAVYKLHLNHYRGEDTLQLNLEHVS
jgi:single-stranded-DNA-specific exonuclease